MRKSGAAIREASDGNSKTFGPAQSVNALNVLGFKSSFGSIKLKKLDEAFFPLIAFKKDGDPLLINEQ